MSNTTNTSFSVGGEPVFVTVEPDAPQVLSHSTGDTPIYYARDRADIEGDFNPVETPTIPVGATHTLTEPVWIRTESLRDRSSVLLLATPETP